MRHSAPRSCGRTATSSSSSPSKRIWATPTRPRRMADDVARRRAGRILALAMAGGLLALAYLSAVRPLVARHGDMREELSDLALQRARLRKIEGEPPRLQATNQDIEPRAGGERLALLQPADPVAA